jgi:phage-related protein
VTGSRKASRQKREGPSGRTSRRFRRRGPSTSRVDSLGHGLREVRSTHDKVEYRVIFILDGNTMVLLHGFVKTTKKTRKADIDIALERKAIREKSR